MAYLKLSAGVEQGRGCAGPLANVVCETDSIFGLRRREHFFCLFFFFFFKTKAAQKFGMLRLGLCGDGLVGRMHMKLSRI